MDTDVNSLTVVKKELINIDIRIHDVNEALCDSVKNPDYSVEKVFNLFFCYALGFSRERIENMNQSTRKYIVKGFKEIADKFKEDK